MFEKEIEKKVKKLTTLKRKQSLISRLKKSNHITCIGNIKKGCGSLLKIKELTYIQTHWYEYPWGCTGGDRWWEGEANFICPNCGIRNRPFFFKEWELLKDYKFSLIKHKFKNHIDEYEK